MYVSCYLLDFAGQRSLILALAFVETAGNVSLALVPLNSIENTASNSAEELRYVIQRTLQNGCAGPANKE